MPPTVTSTRLDSVTLVTLDNPPVNAMALPVRVALREALTGAAGDPAVRAVVLTGAGKLFSGGADIREFDTGVSNEPPTLRDLIAAVEDSPKPVVAALHGTAVGGGCELALACHARVALAGTQIGLPEVTLGLVPGAGGTQRLPRLIGVEAALDAILSGKPLAAEKAIALGLVDVLVPAGGDVVTRAKQLAEQLASTGSWVKTRDRDDHVAAARGRLDLFAEQRKQVARKQRGFEAPLACIDCVEAAVTKPFDEGLAFERETFQRCRTSPQSAAQRHAFFAEREARRVRGVSAETAERPIARAAVIGCGTMGGGIAMCFANAGIPVVVTEESIGALERGMDLVRKNYAGSVTRGSLSAAEAEARLALIEPTLDFERVSTADAVVEAVFESMELKKEIFTRLDALCRQNALLATNTSSLDVNEIAATTSRPEDVVGMHFFSPANVMRLVEIVRGAKSSPEALATALALSRRLGKVGVVVGVCDSFAANRMLYPYTRQAAFLLEEGALPEQVDRVLYEFGFPMGPFAVGDLAGLDVGYKIRQHRERQRPKHLRYSRLADKLCRMDRYGQKTGKGWYLYEKGSRTPVPDPEVTALIVAESARLGIDRRVISDKEILERCLYALVNEGAKILEEGIAERASDLDLVWLHGYGFPRYRGGPMYWADSIGLDRVLDAMERFHTEHGEWMRPAALLERLGHSGGRFGAWKAT